MNRVALIVMSIIIVAGITILILWLTGVLFKSKRANDSISNNTKEGFIYYPEYFENDIRWRDGLVTTIDSLENKLDNDPIYKALTNKDVINIGGKTKVEILADFKNAYIIFMGQESNADPKLKEYVCNKANRERFTDFMVDSTQSVAGLILLSDFFSIATSKVVTVDGNILPLFKFKCGENDEADVCNEQNVTKVILMDGPPIDLEKLTFEAINHKSSLDKVKEDLEEGNMPNMKKDMEDIEFVDKTEITSTSTTYYYRAYESRNVLSTIKDVDNSITTEREIKYTTMSKEQFKQLMRKYMEFLKHRVDITYQLYCTDAGRAAMLKLTEARVIREKPGEGTIEGTIEGTGEGTIEETGEGTGELSGTA